MGVLAWVSGANVCASDSDLIAQAMHVPKDQVTETQRLVFSNAQGIITMVAGIAREKNRGVAVIAPLLKCPHDCLGELLRVVRAEHLQPWQIIDLKAAPDKINLTRPSTDFTSNAPIDIASYRNPALLLRMSEHTKDGKTTETYSLVALTIPPRDLWQAVTRSASATRGGHETLEMRFEKGSRDNLDITLLQHALPRPDQKSVMPGPPLTLKFVWNGQRYEHLPE